MAENPFPHLHFSYVGKLKAKFPPGFSRKEQPEVIANRSDPKRHATTLRGILEGLEKDYRDTLEQRKKAGLPIIEKGKGFLLRLKDGVDADEIAHALNLELVAEAEGGFILVSTEDVSFEKFYGFLDRFEGGQDGGGRALAVIEAFRQADDDARLRRILAPEVFQMWPFKPKGEYTFDLSIQTSPSLRTVKFQKVRQRKGETDEAFHQRKRNGRDIALANASDRWTESAEARFFELARIVEHFKGHLLSGFSSAPDKPINNGVRFADCILVRVKMCGEGFHDVVFNLPHLFEISIPEELKVASGDAKDGGSGKPTVKQPDKNAPAVCVIDSGIEEGHLWLAPAIDGAASKCFLPGVDEKEVQDEVRASGHGTRVAGAILYPTEIPKTGEVLPAIWLQNARVLDSRNQVPEELPPARYLTEVVEHALKSAKAPKIFNHSIAAGGPCPTHRMAAWASKIDELSANLDVLFVQCAGNVPDFLGPKNNPSIEEHRKAGREYPHYLLTDSCRVANPAQSLHALTVGAISGAVFDNADLKSFGASSEHPASYSRTGFGMWNVIKPEVVEVGGDQCHEKGKLGPCIPRPEVATELLCSTRYGSPAFARDGTGTSFAAPKVAHIAALVQTVFPDASPHLYRALVVQSARWPGWAEGKNANRDQVLRHIGYGKPDSARATQNNEQRVTLVTPNSVEIRNYDLHLYSIKIPPELRTVAGDAKIRMEVTLCYTSEPRRTRRSRYGYLRTRLSWRCSGLGESIEEFRKRIQGEKGRYYPQPRWTIHHTDGHGEAEETNRDRGSAQKDWAYFEPHELASEVAIAVRAHNGWDHRKEEGLAHYFLVVSFEISTSEIPIYSLVREAQAKVEAEIQPQITIPAM